jgi:bifunctional DNA-binding transcriptional regulator/antitoxin component of YhaV-PrlF toxin-antitoxin module
VESVLPIVVVDDKGRILLSRELREESGVEKNDHLIAKSLSKGRILLEKPARQPRSRRDPLDWLLSHPAKIRSSNLRNEVKKKGSTRELLEDWKEHPFDECLAL